MVVVLAIVPAIGEAKLNASAAPKTFPTVAEGSYDRRARSTAPEASRTNSRSAVIGIILLIKTARALSSKNSDLNFVQWLSEPHATMLRLDRMAANKATFLSPW
jgi:hypothetical protein